MSTAGHVLKPATQARHELYERTAAQSASITAQILDRIGDACLGIAIVIVPLSSAVVRETGVALFIACSLLMGLTWAIRQTIEPLPGARFSAAEVIVLAAISLVCLQLAELSPDLLNLLSPFASTHLPSWGLAVGETSESASWKTISLTPALTRSGLVLLIAYSVFLLTLIQRIRNSADVERCLKIVAVSAVIMAAIGLGQVLTRSDEFLWVFEHPSRVASWPAKGAFTNQNHFAHFLALGIGPLIWWWSRSKTKKTAVSTGRRSFGDSKARGRNRQVSLEQILLTGAVSLVGLAGLASTSRGGICAILIAIVIALIAVGAGMRSVLKLTLPVGLFILIGSVEIGTDKLREKWESITGATSITQLTSGRTVLWESLAEAVPSFWRAGSGLGSHAEVYPIWMSRQFNVRFSHAESGYLQVLLELGLPGLLLLLCGICVCGFWMVKTYRNSSSAHGRACILILASGLAASVLHSLVDFVWYLPGCLIPTLVLVACVCRSYQFVEEGPAERTPSKWPMRLAWLILILAVPVAQVSAAQATRDATSEGHGFAARNDNNTPEERIEHLEACLRSDPSDYRTMSRLATLYLDRFQRQQGDSANNMSVMELRSTVRTSEFGSQREVAEWLVRAFGKHSVDLYRANVMAKKALLGQPLRGETYAVLAQVGFLLGMSPEAEDELLQQAMIIRPHASYVHYLFGLSLATKGQLDESCESLSRAFALDRDLRPTITNELSPYLSAAEFIERIKPEADGLWHLFRAYDAQNLASEQAFVAEWYAEHIRDLIPEGSLATADFWKRSETIFRFAERPEQTVYCLKKLTKRSPTDFAARKRLALALLENGQLKQSRVEFEWCRMRTPDDEDITAALARIDEALRTGESE